MLVQVSTPPPAVAPAPQPPPQATRMMTIAQRARPLTLTKGGRAETAVVRQQIFIRTAVTPGPTASVEGQAIIARPCAWAIQAYLQREICFYSMTGLTSCTDPISAPLSAGETGRTDLAADQECDVLAGPVELAEGRIIKSIDGITAVLFDEDYRLKVRPMLLASGVTIADQSPKPAPNPASGSGTR